MFVLPRPPPPREGRRAVLAYTTRPVTELDDDAAASHTKRAVLSSLNNKVISNEGSEWFPCQPATQTYQDEFSARTNIMNSYLEGIAAMHTAFVVGCQEVVRASSHSLTFDEQWEREAIESDWAAEVWIVFSTHAVKILTSELVKEEAIARTAIEQFAATHFLCSLGTAEYIERRQIQQEFTDSLETSGVDGLLELVQLHVQDVALRTLSELTRYEVECRRYMKRLELLEREQRSLIVAERQCRLNLIAAHHTSVRMLVTTMIREGKDVLWATDGLLHLAGGCEDGHLGPLVEVSLRKLFDGSAALIQAHVKGWLARRRRWKRM